MFINFIQNFIHKSFIYLVLYPIIDFTFVFTDHDIYNKYCSYGTDRKLYILSNLAKSIFLINISVEFIKILYMNRTLFALDWGQNSNEIKYLVVSYVIPDLWSIMITTKTMKLSTIFHHVCVIIATIFIMFSDLNQPGVHIAFIMYGLFSAYTFMVNFFLGARFVTKLNNNFLTTTSLTYVLSCSLNWNWQAYYAYQYFYFHYQWIIFITLLYFWIKDDIILIKFLLNYKK
jgi:hypothetical protein